MVDGAAQLDRHRCTGRPWIGVVREAKRRLDDVRLRRLARLVHVSVDGELPRSLDVATVDEDLPPAPVGLRGISHPDREIGAPMDALDPFGLKEAAEDRCFALVGHHGQPNDVV